MELSLKVSWYPSSPSSPQELTALFQPFSMCEDYISPNYLKTELSKCILRAMRFVHDLSDDDMKDKEVRGGCVWG